MRNLTKLLWIALATILIGYMISPSANAHSIASATLGKTSVTLYTEPCTLKAITNLPQKAVWTEEGKQFEGCWAPTQFDVVITYWDDSTVALTPFAAFVKVGPAI